MQQRSISVDGAPPVSILEASRRCGISRTFFRNKIDTATAPEFTVAGHIVRILDPDAFYHEPTEFRALADYPVPPPQLDKIRHGGGLLSRVQVCP